MMKLDRFTRGSRNVNGANRRFQYARCGACLATGEVNDAATAWHPPEAVAKKLEQRGWFIGKAAAKDRCPACNLHRAKTKPEGDTEAMAVTVQTEPKPEPMTERQAISAAAVAIREGLAEPPREPTREDKRRIMDELEDAYLPARSCYRVNLSDMMLAGKLSVPRAWVERLREEFYGPDTNEDTINRASAKDAALIELEHRAKDLEDKCMTLASQCEALRRDVAKARAA